MDTKSKASDADLGGVLDAATIEGLKELCDPGDLSLFRDLIDTFLADSPDRIAAVECAIGTNDATALERAAHALKSSAANMGALGLASLCKPMESLGRGGQVAGAAELARKARAEFELVRQAFARIRG